jgi:hypothetical protein
MEELTAKLADFGVLGVMCALLVYNVIFLQKKVISIVENNTKAFGELKTIIEKCQLIHKE